MTKTKPIVCQAEFKKSAVKLAIESNRPIATPVESLINRRCKGPQHMRWSRDGL
jgi:hypothetical protein